MPDNSIRINNLRIETDTSVGQTLPVSADFEWKQWTGDRIRRLRKLREWTQERLAEASGLDKETVNRFENGIGSPRLGTASKIARAFGISVDDLLAQPLYTRAEREADAVEPGFVDVSGHTTSDIPVIAEGEASPQGELFWDDAGQLKSDVEDRITRPYDVRDPRAYGVKVRGDSMLPAYKPGMVLVISPNIPVGDGDEVYVQLLNGERLIKIARRMADGWLLESINPIYESRFVKKSDVGAMHPVLWARRKR